MRKRHARGKYETIFFQLQTDVCHNDQQFHSVDKQKNEEKKRNEKQPTQKNKTKFY